MKWYFVALIGLAALAIGVLIGKSMKSEASSPAKPVVIVKTPEEIAKELIAKTEVTA